MDKAQDLETVFIRCLKLLSSPDFKTGSDLLPAFVGGFLDLVRAHQDQEVLQSIKKLISQVRAILNSVESGNNLFNLAEIPLLSLKREILFFELLLWSKKKELAYKNYRQNYDNETKNDKSSNGKLSRTGETILELIKEKTEVKSEDIYSLFPEMSKRTIRRNLSFLVNLGFINRVVSNNNSAIYRFLVESPADSKYNLTYDQIKNQMADDSQNGLS